MSTGPTPPTVLNTTAPSNFAYIDRMELLTVLPGVCTVPAVQDELRAGVESYPYLQHALDCLGESIPVRTLNAPTEATASEVETRLDPGEASAFAVADSQNGTLVTDDGPARRLARNNEVPVTGSIGILIIAVEADRISESDADRWLKQWIDDTEYRAPSRDLSDYL